MSQNTKLYSDRMNDEVFRIYIPEYYQPTLPSYFKQHRNSGYAVVNGRMVTDEEYQELTGETVVRDDFVPQPIYSAAELNMCISSCTPAMVVDMDVNNVPFRFQDIEDMPKICEIMDGYEQEMHSYISRSAELKHYIETMRGTCIKLRAAYAEIKRDRALNSGQEPERSNSLADLLKLMK